MIFVTITHASVQSQLAIGPCVQQMTFLMFSGLKTTVMLSLFGFLFHGFPVTKWQLYMAGSL